MSTVFRLLVGNEPKISYYPATVNSYSSVHIDQLNS